MVIGAVPTQKSPVKMMKARIKFIVTHATSTSKREKRFFVMNDHFFLASVPVGSSPRIRTKPPIGRRFIVKSVPFLSRKTLATRGGIPKPNSSTFIPVTLAARKCPSSWIRTTIRKTMKVRRIPRIMAINYLANWSLRWENRWLIRSSSFSKSSRSTWNDCPEIVIWTFPLIPCFPRTSVTSTRIFPSSFLCFVIYVSSFPRRFLLISHSINPRSFWNSTAWRIISVIDVMVKN